MIAGVIMPKKPKRNDSSVKIEAEIVRKARTIASYKDITLAEYLSDMLRPLVSKEFERFKKLLNQEAD